MRKLKFNVGDTVLPTPRASKELIEAARFNRPKVIQGTTSSPVYGDWRNRRVYLIGGPDGKISFLAEELQLVKRGKK